MKSKRVRIDQLLVDQGLVDSRNKAQALIRVGNVLVNESVVDKPGTKVSSSATIRVRGNRSAYVSRGGDKLAAAIDYFEVDCRHLVCADLGASTGGFTDCLLQRGAQKVYAVDVGYGQLAWKLRQDPRVVVMERTNARYLQQLPEPIEMLVGDLSFISLTKIIPAMRSICISSAIGILLIKPQFEVGPDGISQGKVKSPQLRQNAIDNTIASFRSHSIDVVGHLPSPIAGAKKGNVEELMFVRFPL